MSGKTYTKEEQAEHRRLWAEALRSGEYKQGTQALRGSTGTFCCLGVACDLAARDGLGEWEGAYFHTSAGEAHFQVLPKSIQEWLGVTSDSGMLEFKTEYGTEGDLAWLLTELNDYAGYTFAQIADLIESGGVKVQ